MTADNPWLMLGDCLERMKEIPDASVDMILCDLPYGTTACKWDVVIPFEPLWQQYKRVIKPKGAILLFGSEPFSTYLRMSNIEWWIWQKDKGGNWAAAKFQPMKTFELISVFSEASHYYSPIMDKRPEKTQATQVEPLPMQLSKTTSDRSKIYRHRKRRKVFSDS